MVGDSPHITQGKGSQMTASPCRIYATRIGGLSLKGGAVLMLTLRVKSLYPKGEFDLP